MATARLIVELPGGLELDQLLELLRMHDVTVRSCTVGAVEETEERPRPACVTLTESERAVLRAFTYCNRNEEIAAALHVSPETVRWHAKSLYRKLRVNSRAFAVGRALRLGLLTPEDLAPPNGGQNSPGEG